MEAKSIEQADPASDAVVRLAKQRDTLKVQLDQVRQELHAAESEVMRQEVRYSEAFELRKTIARQIYQLDSQIQKLKGVKSNG